MIYRSILPLLALLWVGSAFAQDEDTLPVGAVLERSIPASRSAEAFRPVGEYRIWRFFGKQTTFGQLVSTVKGRTEIDDRSALILEESLQIDYSKIGGERKVVSRGETYVSDDGRYLGSRLEMGDGQTSERFEVARTDETLEGFYTRAGTEQSISVPYETERFFWDVNFVDQLEYFLAMRDLEIGSRIDDSIYLPQSLMSARIVGHVAWFMHKEIYKNKFDSVFVIQLTQPSDYQLYITPDKRLVRVDLIHQDARVYQDIVGRSSVPTTTQAGSTLSARTLLFKLPHYVAFLIVAGLVVLFFATSAFRWSATYLFIGSGILIYLAIPLVANPLLVRIIEHWLRPMMTGGGSLYLAGAVPPLLLSLTQVGLMLVAFILLRGWIKSKAYRFIGLGAVLGAGFGLAEAVYVSGLQIGLLFDWPLAERTSLIAVHITSGALLGWCMAAGRARQTLPVIFIAGTIARYLPLLVQGGLVGVEAMHFVLVLGSILYLFLALVTVKREPKRRVVDDTAGPAPD